MNNNFSPFLKKTFICFFATLLSMQMLWAQKSYTSVCSVHFATDKYNLNTDAVQLLDSFIKQVNLSTDYLIEIEANTDADGTNEYNNILSNNRANSVREYLLQKGITTNKTKAKWNGELKPKFTNDTDNGKAGNRRVDLKTTLYKFENVNDLFSTVAENVNQNFDINASSENKIKAKQGTEISIPADAFVFEDGTVAKGKIDFVVKEALQTEDILLSGLTTVSNGKLLQTGGMVYIEASINGKKLKLAKDKNIKIAMPAKKVVDGMELFYGEKNKNGAVNWKATGQPANTIELNVDKSNLSKAKIKSGALKFPKLYYKDELYQPAKPLYPRKPVEPKEPKYYTFKPNFFQKIFYSDEMKMKKELALNNPKKKHFEKQAEAYEKARMKYDNQMKKYNEIEMPEYSKKLDDYKNELAKRATAINSAFDAYAKNLATKYINRRIDAYLKKPITNRTRLNLSNLTYNVDYFNPTEFVVNTIGLQNIKNDRIFRIEKRDKSFKLFDINGDYFAPEKLILNDGSKIITNMNALVNQHILQIIDSSGLNDLVDDYNKKILEASAKAGALDNSELSSYVYTVNKTDWINCDRFVENPNPVAVKIDEQDEAKVFIVCHDVNGYLPAYKFENNYVAGSIPKNSNITIVSVKLLSGKIFMATEKTKANENDTHKMNYKECTLAQMRAELKKIDSNS